MSRWIVFQLLAAVAISFTPQAVNALTCAVCPATIVVSGAPFIHTGGHESSGNIVQCDYSPQVGPPGSVIPTCLYTNANGALFFQNAGGCPASAPLQTQTGPAPSCTFPG